MKGCLTIILFGILFCTGQWLAFILLLLVLSIYEGDKN